jgi:uncharacterized protein (TIGR03437 family)
MLGWRALGAELRGKAVVRRINAEGGGSLLAAAGAARYEVGATSLQSRQSLQGGQFGARLMLDPALTQQKKLVADDGTAFYRFGSSVALCGETAVIGAPDDVTGQGHGSAYVFVRNGGAWTMQQKLTADDGAAGDGFGFSVAIGGDTVVVGAPRSDTAGKMNQGAAYVFVRSGVAWTKQQKLTADDGAAGDGLGFSVAISGDTVAVGAASKNVTFNGQGAAYVFTRSGAAQPVWTQQQRLIADDGAGGDEFGYSVAVSGDTVVVGASIDTIGQNSDQGSAYVFVRGGVIWSKQQKLTADDGEAGDQFGSAVAVSGDTIVVSAPLDDIGQNSDQGSAYVFVRNGAAQPVWTKQQKLTADDGEARDTFGISVATSGDALAVGSYHDKIGENIIQGSAYTFTRGGAAQPVWTKQQKLTAADGEVGDLFGSSVAIGNDTVLVGASGDEIGQNVIQGSAYVFASADCQFSVAPTNQAFAPQGGAGVINVGADGACAWTAVSNDPSITITSGASGSGAGAVMFTVSANPNPGSRLGTLTVAGRQVRVAQAAPAVSVSAASFAVGDRATESILAAFGAGLAKTVATATALPLPTTLGGTRVSVIDSAGTERLAPLFFVSPTQINFQAPPGTAAGQALVTIITDDKTVAAESPRIAAVSPGLFSADSNGTGVVTGVALRVKGDGTQSFEPVARFDQASGRFVVAPIDLVPDTDQVFLVMFATGVRNRSGLGAVSVKVGGVSAETIYAGPQGTFTGLDQVNVTLPRNLAGRGEVDVRLTVDGVAANALNIAIR